VCVLLVVGGKGGEGKANGQGGARKREEEEKKEKKEGRVAVGYEGVEWRRGGYEGESSYYSRWNQRC